MKILVILLSGSLLLTACGGVKKSLNNRSAEPAVTTTRVEPIEEVVEKPIIEVEEKLTPLNEIPPDPSRYFVIIGSFRNPSNAARYQEQILKDGYRSSLLRNEEGLIRVSVLATDDITGARSEIKRIREQFPKYFDTWLLVQKK